MLRGLTMVDVMRVSGGGGSWAPAVVGGGGGIVYSEGDALRARARRSRARNFERLLHRLALACTTTSCL